VNVFEEFVDTYESDNDLIRRFVTIIDYIIHNIHNIHNIHKNKLKIGSSTILSDNSIKNKKTTAYNIYFLHYYKRPPLPSHLSISP